MNAIVMMLIHTRYAYGAYFSSLTFPWLSSDMSQGSKSRKSQDARPRNHRTLNTIVQRVELLLSDQDITTVIEICDYTAKESTSHTEAKLPDTISLAELTASYSSTIMDHNSAAPTVDSMHTFIYTAELCEQSLSHLECDDLTRARRVCHYFKAVIDPLPRLRQELFLTPRSTETLGLSPLRETILIAASGSQEQVRRTESEGNSLNGFSPIYHDLHPALEPWYDHDLQAVRRLERFFHAQGGPYPRWAYLKFTDKLASQTTLLARESLLGAIFICQPPFDRLIGQLMTAKNHPTIELCIHQKDGIRFKHILEHLPRQEYLLGIRALVWEGAAMSSRK